MKAKTALLALIAALVLVPLQAGAKEDEDALDCLDVVGPSGARLMTYSIDDLKTAFPVQDLVTQTPWTKDGRKIHYRGVYLRDILAEHDLEKLDEVEVFADDGFLSQIALDEIESYSPVMAFEQRCTDEEKENGLCPPGQDFRLLTIEDQGPFFLIWPYHELPEQYVPSRNNLWVWWVIGIRPAQ